MEIQYSEQLRDQTFTAGTFGLFTWTNRLFVLLRRAIGMERRVDRTSSMKMIVDIERMSSRYSAR